MESADEELRPCPFCAGPRRRHTVTGQPVCARCDVGSEMHGGVVSAPESKIAPVQWAGKKAKPQGPGWTQGHTKAITVVFALLAMAGAIFGFLSTTR